MLWAVTGHTAAELIADLANTNQPNMGLTSWVGSRVRQSDVTTAKNYLHQAEMNELNRIVVMYLDYAEDMAQRRNAMTMQHWIEKLDTFLRFNEREVLNHAGKIRADVAEQLVLERYTAFDIKRLEVERLAADEEDMKLLEQIERKIEGNKQKKNK